DRYVQWNSYEDDINIKHLLTSISPYNRQKPSFGTTIWQSCGDLQFYSFYFGQGARHVFPVYRRAPTTPGHQPTAVSLQQDRDLIIEYREVFASALRLADRLVASKHREAKVASCTQGASALPEIIDRHWEEVCQGSECWRDWWNSGRPKKLRHAPELAIPPTQPGNRTPPEATPSSTSVAEPPPPPSSTPGSGPSRRQTPAKPTQIYRYCNRKGHNTEDCHTRTAELRQERLLRRVLADGGYLAAASPSVTPHLQPFPQSHPFSAQPVNWGHTQGLAMDPARPSVPPTEPCHTTSGRTTTPSNMEPDSLLYLKEALDVLLVTHRCQHILLLGDLNHHLERDAYENLLTVQGLKDHVTFPTHELGETLDPVISDLEEDTQLPPAGSRGQL
ncbi:hypothetical protein O3P69_017735, partial [Scylla paramamosain]